MSKKTAFLLILFLIFTIGSYLIYISFNPAINSIQKYIPTVSPLVVPNASISPNFQSVRVERVIDGDTIVLTTGEKIRYIGVNTPEIVDPSRPEECYGKEAADKNRELVSERIVLLERDISDKDKYGRLLRYAYVSGKENNQIMINEELVKEGFAKADVYKPDVKYEEMFAKAQLEARNQNLGLWGACTETIRQ